MAFKKSNVKVKPIFIIYIQHTFIFSLLLSLQFLIKKFVVSDIAIGIHDYTFYLEYIYIDNKFFIGQPALLS